MLNQLLKTYQHKLLRIDGSNKSLLMLKPTDGDFDLYQVQHLLNFKSSTIIDALIAGESNIKICPIVDARSEEVNKLSLALKNLLKCDKQILDETGISNLSIGWPWVKGRLMNNTPVHCPLLLWDVSLTVQDYFWTIVIDNDTPVVFNKSFLMAYSQHQTKLDIKALTELKFNGTYHSTTSFKTQLYHTLKNYGIELNFNQELFQDALIPFAVSNKKSFEDTTNTGVLKLFSYSILGQFSQGENRVGQDLEEILKQNEYNTIEDFFETKFQKNIHHSESSVLNILPLDAWQEEAILKAKRGDSLVLQGPPGSGKSQFITNIISDYVSSGKNVLVVSHKKTALEVIYQRLSSHNLNHFVALLHHIKIDKKNIFEKILYQIEECRNYKQQNSSYGSLLIEQKHKLTCKQMNQLLKQLILYKEALFDESLFGISVKQLYLTTRFQTQSGLDFAALPQLNYQQIMLNKSSYIQYFQLLHTVHANSTLWQNRKNYLHFTIHQKNNVLSAVKDLENISKADIALHQLMPLSSLSLSSCLDTLTLLGDAAKQYQLLLTDSYFNKFSQIVIHRHQQTFLNNAKTAIDDAAQFESDVIALFDTSKLIEVIALLEQALIKLSQPMDRFLYKLFSSQYRKVKVILQNLNKVVSTENIAWLIKILSKAILLNQTAEKYKSQLQSFPIKASEAHIQDYFKQYSICIDMFWQLSTHITEPVLQYYISNNHSDQLKALIQYAIQRNDNINRLSQLLSNAHIHDILNGAINPSNLVEAIAADFENLIKIDELYFQFTEGEKKLLAKASVWIGHKTEEQIFETLFNALKQEWIKVIEQKFPVLTHISSHELNEIENDLQRLEQEKLEMAKQILLAKLKEQVYVDLEYNRLNHQISYRDLKHQVSKKRNRWSLRNVISTHRDEVFKLIPCWLVSPDALSAVFDIDTRFDLVVFDEASQCNTEFAFPALWRSKQVIIAGDSKQLAPHTLYQSHWEYSETTELDEEIDALLHLGERYLPTYMLRGHYRSQYEALIDFSNFHFYKNQLQFLPHYDDYKAKHHVLKLHQSRGEYINGINKSEAEDIFSYLTSIKDILVDTSIGIICFSYAQSQYLLDLKEKNKLEFTDTIFENIQIKNIENVQGDEYDWVILSLGYSSNQAKTVTSSRLGNLNRQDGENRLNVAITRAKKQMLVFSSLLPQQLDVEESKYNGPKLLKRFLEYVVSISDDTHLQFNKADNGSTFQPLWAKLDYEPIQAHNFADAMATHDQSHKVLIFTDDDNYANSENIKEYHLYKKIEAKRKNWIWKNFISREHYLYQKQ